VSQTMLSLLPGREKTRMLTRRSRTGQPSYGATCDWCDDDVPAVLSAWADGREDARACVTHAANLPCYVLCARDAARRARRDPYGLRDARKRDHTIRRYRRAVRRGREPVPGWSTRHYHRWRCKVATLRLRSAEMFTRWRARYIARAARPRPGSAA
jgi:hypothetical protein